jgi:hypothetical protein
MKITKTLLLGAVVATAASAINQNVRADDLASAAALASASVNRLILASPHGLEEYTWLMREAQPRTETTAGSESVVSSIKKNRALAASPRMIEQFPELARFGQPLMVAASKQGTRTTPLDRVIRNRALAASPRMKEEFPALARGYPIQSEKESFELAPVK